jgi:hypothetical protein
LHQENFYFLLRESKIQNHQAACLLMIFHNQHKAQELGDNKHLINVPLFLYPDLLPGLQPHKQEWPKLKSHNLGNFIFHSE